MLRPDSEIADYDDPAQLEPPKPTERYVSKIRPSFIRSIWQSANKEDGGDDDGDAFSSSSSSWDYRPEWDSHFDYVMASISCTVGLGNMWRFPQLTYSGGGGTFLIPYTIGMFCLGIPMYCLELFFGQYASLGPIAIWEANPMFKGIGLSMVVLSTFLLVYHGIVVSWCLTYICFVFDTPLRWTVCNNEWNTCHCITLKGQRRNDSGLNCSDADTDIIKISSDEYFHNRILKISGNIFEFGSLQMEVTLCNLFVWAVIFVCIFEGMKTIGKVAYISSLGPYLLVVVIIIGIMTQPGAEDGIKFYLKPDTFRLQDTRVWKDAASQIFFSLGTNAGTAITLSSYNKFNNRKVLLDGIMIPCVDFVLSLVAGLAVFAMLGILSRNTGVPIDKVMTEGPGVMFGTYPEALSLLPLPNLWSCLFFIWLAFLGIGVQFTVVEAILTAFQDEFFTLRRYDVSVHFRRAVCILLYLTSIPLALQSGYYIVNLLDMALGYAVVVIAFMETIAVVWVYGHHRLSNDILMMIGWSPCTQMLLKYYFRYCWVIVSPFLTLVILIGSFSSYEPITSKEYPMPAEVLFLLAFLLITIWIPLWYIKRLWINCFKYKHKGILAIIRRSHAPSSKWGPKMLDRTVAFSRQWSSMKNLAVARSQHYDTASKGTLAGSTGTVKYVFETEV